MNYSIKNKYLTATINPIGAELTTLKSDSKNYIWEVDLQYWNKTSPILFPIVGRLINDTYIYNEKKYNLPRHGFARNFEFKVLEMNEISIVFSLESNNETKENYPFDFELQIGYFLDEKNLKVTYKVINKNDFEIPFSIGGHPAFSLPNTFEKYSLEFENQEILNNYSLENEMLTNDFEPIELENKTLLLSYSLFEKDALIFKSLQSKKVAILEEGKPFLSVIFNDFPSLGIWTKIGAPFLCIEPWFGFADNNGNINCNNNINEKEGIVLLPMNKEFNCEYVIEIN
jgi:galactose mutarotase-like enzyme